MVTLFDVFNYLVNTPLILVALHIVLVYLALNLFVRAYIFLIKKLVSAIERHISKKN